MYLTLTAEGATLDEIARGLDAAQAVFDRADITALQAAEGWFAVEGWDIHGFDDNITVEELQHFDVWCDAKEAALEACCAGWAEERKPVSASLELIDSDRHCDKLRSLKPGGAVLRQV